MKQIQMYKKNEFTLDLNSLERRKQKHSLYIDQSADRPTRRPKRQTHAHTHTNIYAETDTQTHTHMYNVQRTIKRFFEDHSR